jgi:hypothetical protein
MTTMKLNFWQWLGIVLLVLGGVLAVLEYGFGITIW